MKSVDEKLNTSALDNSKLSEKSNFSYKRATSKGGVLITEEIKSYQHFDPNYE